MLAPSPAPLVLPLRRAGLGDIVLPGLLAVFTRRLDLAAAGPGGRRACGYFLPCAFGYGAGLLLTYAALYFSWFGDSGQPALLYLVPCTLGTVWLLACARGEAAALWTCDLEADKGGSRGDRGQRGVPADEEALLGSQ